MGHEIVTALNEYLHDVARWLAQFLPRLLTAVLLVFVGYLIARALGALTRRVLRLFNFNGLIERFDTQRFLEQAKLGHADQLAGKVVFWITWAGMFLSAVRTLGISEVDILVQEFVHYLPKLFSSVAILVVGVFLSTVAWRASLLAAVNAQIPAAKQVATVVRGVTMIVAIAMALEQLELGQQVILTAFAISFGAVMLGLALAFGLGGQDLARRYLERRLQIRERVSTNPGEGPSHL